MGGSSKSCACLGSMFICRWTLPQRNQRMCVFVKPRQQIDAFCLCLGPSRSALQRSRCFLKPKLRANLVGSVDAKTAAGWYVLNVDSRNPKAQVSRGGWPWKRQMIRRRHPVVSDSSHSNCWTCLGSGNGRSDVACCICVLLVLGRHQGASPNS